jgi:TetR/AcrR family transcriptional repressor of nem operon
MSIEIAAQNPEIRKTLIQAFDAWEDAIATALREAIENGELRSSDDPGKLAALLINGWEGAQVRSKALQSYKPLNLFFNHAFEVLLKGEARL